MSLIVPLPAFGSQNVLVHADALVLLERVVSSSVDLCYIDPPLFPKVQDASGETRTRIMRDHLLALARVIQHARRCLAATGNLFVHSEPEMNGNIRLLLDQIFGRENFRQEIVVRRPASKRHGDFPSSHDTVFHFSAGPEFIFNPQTRPLTADEIATRFSMSDERGRYRLVGLTSPVARPSLSFEWRGAHPASGSSWRYSRDKLEEFEAEGRIVFPLSGTIPRLKQYVSDSSETDVGTVWDDLPLRLSARERVDFPTQKSERLADRIVRMGSSVGDVVLDPYCGSGTTLISSGKTGRKWIGGDNCVDAISLSARRLRSECGVAPTTEFVSATEEELKARAQSQVVPRLRIATGFDDLLATPVGHLVFGRPLEIEETREYEFKEVTSNRPSDSIANTADEYAVAFLNSEGGRIFWGVRNSDRVIVGVKLTLDERDRMRQVVTNKLGAIRPAIDPTSYRLEIYPVEHPNGNPDLFVVELVVPTVKATMPYFTSGNDAFVRLDGIKRKLAGPELAEWIVRRMTNT